MARILIVGCGCRGGMLAKALLAKGYAVRGTSRRAERVAGIEAVGAEAILADPERLTTLLPHLEGVSALCWLMASAAGDHDSVGPLHGARLQALAESLIDTHVRGLVYEAAGSVPASVLAEGAHVARHAQAAHRI